MIHKWEVVYNGRFAGFVNSMTEHGARQQAEIMVEQLSGRSRSASLYSGLDIRNIQVRRV